jgi:hypothetical protein
MEVHLTHFPPSYWHHASCKSIALMEANAIDQSRLWLAKVCDISLFRVSPLLLDLFASFLPYSHHGYAGILSRPCMRKRSFAALTRQADKCKNRERNIRPVVSESQTLPILSTRQLANIWVQKCNRRGASYRSSSPQIRYHGKAGQKPTQAINYRVHCW